MLAPASFTSGDTVSFTVPAQGDKTSAAYALTYRLVGKGALSITAAADGTGWKVTATSAQTATLPSGDYAYALVLTKTGERHTVEYGQVAVTADVLSAAVGYDGRTQAQRDLEAVRAAIRAIVAGGAVAEYSIGNRSLKKMAMSDLLALETSLKADVAREKMAAKPDGGRSVFVRFGVR